MEPVSRGHAPKRGSKGCAPQQRPWCLFFTHVSGPLSPLSRAQIDGPVCSLTSLTYAASTPQAAPAMTSRRRTITPRAAHPRYVASAYMVGTLVGDGTPRLAKKKRRDDKSTAAAATTINNEERKLVPVVRTSLTEASYLSIASRKAAVVRAPK